MFTVSKSFGLAILFILVSALLHIFAPLVGGFGSEALRLIVVGLLYAVIGYFLIPNRRWLAWFTFFLMLAGSIAAFTWSMSISAVPGWWWMLFVAADCAAAAMLFIYLWYPKPVIR